MWWKKLNILYNVTGGICKIVDKLIRVTSLNYTNNAYLKVKTKIASEPRCVELNHGDKLRSTFLEVW